MLNLQPEFKLKQHFKAGYETPTPVQTILNRQVLVQYWNPNKLELSNGLPRL